MKIGIFGGGFVGHAIARGWMEHAEVLVFDVLPERRTASWEDTAACDLVFLCLPTVAADSPSGYDMAPYEDWFSRRSALPPNLNQIVVVKSTVPPGFTKGMWRRYREAIPNLLHNPEFLTARCAVADYITPAQQVIGSPDLSLWEAAFRLSAIYENRWPGVNVRISDSTTTELAKLALNSFFATKVAFFNAVHNIAGTIGADFSVVREIMLGDGRVAQSHSQVPGPDGRLGFGGACLPKDLGALIAAADDDANRALLNAIEIFNLDGCGRLNG